VKKSQKILLAVCVVILLLAILLIAKNVKTPQVTQSEADVTKPSVVGARDIDFVIKDGKIVSGSNEVTVKKGEQVYIHFQTEDEQPMELRLDGYDIETEMSKYDYGGFFFTADKVGSFNIVLFSDDEPTETAESIVGVVKVEN
jgi:hypothetical protein